MKYIHLQKNLSAQADVYKKLIQPTLKYGPWIAGGSILRWFNNEFVDTDIDVFVNSKDQAMGLINVLKSSMYSMTFSTDNALTFSNGMSPKIQVIVKRYYDKAYDVIDDFDISVCQFLLGDNIIVCTKDAIDHNEKKQLHMTSLQNHKTAFSRLLKYQFRGYNPDKETTELLDAHREDINFSILSDNEY
jgi:hypothetical protein